MEPLQSTPRPAATVVERLAPCVAKIRTCVHACHGTHLERVFLCVRSWDGGGRGRGSQVVASRTEIGCGTKGGLVTPPRVRPERSKFIAGHGVTETGNVVVDQVEPALMEAALEVLGRLGEGEESYFEIETDGRNGSGVDNPVRRFTLVSSVRETFGWKLVLKAAESTAPFARGQLAAHGGTRP